MHNKRRDHALGVLCWVVYMLGASSLPTWSPLRYTTLTSLAGTTTIVAVTAVATALGSVAAPSVQQTAGVAWQIAYVVVPGTVVAVLTWNAGIKRLGPQNTVLFINLVPVITLVIEIARGYHAAWIEIVGVTVTIAALVGNDLWQRRTASGSPRRVRSATSKAA